MSCVNIKSETFANLVKKYGASSGTIELAIKIYLDKNNLEDYNPDDELFKEHMDNFFKKTTFIKYQSLSYFNKAYDVYNKFNNIEIQSLETTKNLFNQLIEAFGNENVLMFETDNGNYKIIISEPKYLDKEDNNLYSKEELEILKNAPKDKEGYLLAPNGKPSNLTRKQYAQVRTKAFKEWFGDWENNPENASKVVDENGEPMIVYHGGMSNINTFYNMKDNPNYENTKHQGYTNKDRVGIYFTKYLSTAKGYASSYNKKQREIYAVFLNIKTPKEVSYKTTLKNRLIKYGTFGLIYKPDVANIKEEELTSIYNNYDGINHSSGEEFIVFNSNQIKSATDNIGTFSKENDRIDRFTEQLNETLDYLKYIGKSINTTFSGSNLSEIFNNFKAELNKIIKTNQELNHYDLGETTKPNDKLEGIKDAEAYSQYIQTLISSIINKLESQGKSIEIKASNINSAMAIDSSGNTIKLYYNPNLLLADFNRFDYILVHELIHSVTSNAINNSFSKTATEEEKQFANDIWDIIKDLYNDKHFHWDFGFDLSTSEERSSHIKEFIANVMTNPNLQSRLAQIKTEDKKQSLWSRFVSAIKNLLNKYLGINIKDSYLEKLMNTISSYIENQTTNIGRYNNDLVDRFTEDSQERTIVYTPIGKSRQTYTIRKNENGNYQIINKEGKEVFKEDSKDRRKIFANLAVKEGRAVVVEYKGQKYVVNKKDAIISVSTGNLMKWGKENGDRKAILDKAHELLFKPETTIDVDSIFQEAYKDDVINEEAQNIVNKIKKDAEEHITFDKETHTYKVDGVEVDTSVTQYVHGKISLGDWGVPSSAIGNTTDTIVRDFFKGELKASYPNISKESLEFIKIDLNSLKKYFDKKFGEGSYKVITDEFPISAKYSEVDKSGNIVTKTMAGTMDMLIYDSEGNFYIYDIKTSRSGINKEKLQGYSKQLYLYKSILEAKYPEIRGRIKETKLIEFKVFYPAPSDETIYTTDDNGQLYLNDTPIQDDKLYSAPQLNMLGNPSDKSILIPTMSVTVDANFNIIKKDSENKEKGNQEKFEQSEDDRQTSSLYNNPLLTASERAFLANNVMYLTSLIITHLKEHHAANSKYFGDKFKSYDFTKMDRQEIIKTVGISTIFDYIKDNFYDINKRSDLDFDMADKLEIAYNNWSALIKIGYPKLITLEGVTVFEYKPDDIQKEDIESSFKEQIESGEIEEREREYWQLGVRNISAKSSLSGEVRRAFERLFVIDEYGNPVKDKFGFNFDTFIDSNVAVNSILSWVNNATSIEEMEDILKEKRVVYPWVNSIYDKIQEEPFRSQFYQNFRKDFTKYSIVNVETDDRGNRHYKTTIINTKGALQSILDEITSFYRTGLMQNIIITADNIEGLGRVNVRNVTKLKTLTENLINQYNIANKLTNKEYISIIDNEVIPKVTEILKELGIRVDDKTVFNALHPKEKPKNINYSDIAKVLNSINYIFTTLLSKEDETSYNPLRKDYSENAGNIYSDYKKIVEILSPYIQDSIESSVYEDGKMYYSFTTPSYMGKLMINLKDSLGNINKFNEFIKTEYDSYRWFKEDGIDGSEAYNLPWLEMLIEDKKMRDLLDHKVQLSFDGTQYTDLGELNYTLSLLSEYFSDPKGNSAWYRVPILANKPSSEFIRFKRFSGINYKNELIKGFKKILFQEIIRIQTVLERTTVDNLQKIGVKDKTTFDISDKVLKTPQGINLVKKLKSKEPLTHSDLVKDGKLITDGSGASFKFLEVFNNEIINNTELGQLIISKINKEEVNEELYSRLVNETINSYMNKMVSSEIEKMNDVGLFDIEETAYKGTKEYDYKHLQKLGLCRSYRTIKGSLMESGKYDNYSKEDLDTLIMSKMSSEANEHLEEYIWNDVFATINILELTITDIAYYGTMENLQKRYSEIHSPSLRFNTHAKFKEENKEISYSKDGFERTVYLKDSIEVSSITANVEEVFNRKIQSITDPREKANMIKMKDLILSSFEEINVADAQGYSSPTSYRKKLGMAGKWDSAMEEAYNRIRSGNFNVNDLGVVWQPLKPFVYSQINKPSYSESMSRLKVPVQNKNSEYLLILANALLRGGDKQNKLCAIFDFMEDSAYDGRETKFDPKTNTYKVIKEGTYNGKGIDTVQFISAVNSGALGAIDINKFDTYEEVLNELKSKAYFNEDRIDTIEHDRYDEDYVHTIPFEDYGIQQEVPAHLKDHEQLMGSQIRILSIGDITPGTRFRIGKDENEVDDKTLIEEYKKLIAENINQSFNDLIEELGIKGSKIERNKKLEKLLQEEILKDSRYGADIQRACTLNENGEFYIPLCDPIQSVRIQQLLNSIIKSRINKQKIKGGPVVQASIFGTSENLSIRFKDKKGNLLDIFNEFAEKNKLNKDNKETIKKYKEYIKENQGSLAYFECYMPIPSSEIEDLLTRVDKNGNKYIMDLDEAIKEGILPEDIRYAIGYRIPTEDKYSMQPLYIKGFLPKAAGEAIMLPKEITLLAGSDFDIDKVYIMLKSFVYNNNINVKKLLDDIMKSSTAKGKERRDRIEEIKMIIEQIQSGMKFSKGSKEDMVYQYYMKNKIKYTKGLELAHDGRGKRNNRIFDIQWTVLTNEDTLSKMFNPGSFDTQKKTARIIRILKELNGYKYKDLINLTIKELDDILGKAQSGNIIFPSTQVYFHKQNMTAGKLIGIFANNNTSHTFLSMQDITLEGDDIEFTFDGITVNKYGNNKLDEQKGKNGDYISKTIAGFLAASVDAVKDPVLNFLNLNTFTAGPAMLLARLGFDVDSIGLLLTQPIIEKVTRLYFSKSNEGYISGEYLIDSYIKSMGIDKQALEVYKSSLSQTMFSKDELVDNIKNSTSEEFEVKTLLLFQKLLSISQELNTLTFLTKFNSVTNAVGPTIADTITMELRYKKFLSKFNEGTSVFNDNARNVIENDPILKAFYDTTVNSEGGASKMIFENYFPHYSTLFTKVLDTIQDNVKVNLNSKIINSIINDFILYLMTEEVIDGSFENRDKYINKFVSLFKDKASQIKDNELLSIIKVKSASRKCPLPTLEAKTGGYAQDTQEKIKDSWSDLALNEETKELSDGLFYYNIFRGGLSFSPKMFLHLASSDIKLGIDGYIDTLRKIIDSDYWYGTKVSIKDFIYQYMRNHSNNYSIVPHINSDELEGVDVEKSDMDLNFTFKDYKQLNKIIVKTINRIPIFSPVIVYNDIIYILDKSNSTSVSYIKSTTLGNTNNFLEYNINEDREMRTVIGYSSKNESTDAKEDLSNVPSNKGALNEGSELSTTEIPITEEEYKYILNNVLNDDDGYDLSYIMSIDERAGLNTLKDMLKKYYNEMKLSEAKTYLGEIIKKLCR